MVFATVVGVRKGDEEDEEDEDEDAGEKRYEDPTPDLGITLLGVDDELDEDSGEGAK
jgi:hypothetical protein